MEEKNILLNSTKENKNEQDDEDEWESIPENEQTEETKDVLYRLNFEGASKIKLDIHKMKNFHSFKMKKLDLKEKDSFKKLDKYIKEKYIPNISIKQNENSNPYATILNNDYVIKKRPEIGTCLIYELNDENQEVKLIGASDTWYETTIFKQKIYPRKKKIKTIINNAKINKGITKKLKKDKKNIKEDKSSDNNNDNKIENVNKNYLKKKRKRRKKSKYTKNSTVIEIKRIFDKQQQQPQQQQQLQQQQNINTNNNNINEDKK